MKKTVIAAMFLACLASPSHAGWMDEIGGLLGGGKASPGGQEMRNWSPV